MAIDGYYINVDFTAIHELAKMMCIDSRNINQSAKAANTYGWVDEKIINDMKAEHDICEYKKLYNTENAVEFEEGEVDFNEKPDDDE